jgi:hypothetical protein
MKYTLTRTLTHSQVNTDDDIIPAGANAGFVASLKFVDSMAPTAAPTDTPVPVLETFTYEGHLITFTDDGKPFNEAPYGNFMLKEYIYTATEGDHAVLQFTEFDVRSYPENRDFVEVFDGESGERLGYFNGQTYQWEVVRSNSMSLRIRFTVGGRGGYQGFEVFCLGQTKATNAPTASGTVSSAPTPAVAGPQIPTTVLALGDEFTHDGSNKVCLNFFFFFYRVFYPLIGLYYYIALICLAL